LRYLHKAILGLITETISPEDIEKASMVILKGNCRTI
jgi:hypothetical protein